MGFIRRPSYYKEFHCIAGACTDSCCKGWDIDIDDDTYAYYMSVDGAFGDRLRAHIAPPDENTGEQAHFITTEEERCPFLNDCELCDIILTLGEEHISQICTYHPRYFDWLMDGEEGGVGLVCEEAARLILQKTGYPEFDETDDGQENELPEDEDMRFELDLQHWLTEQRAHLFRMIKPESGMHPATDTLLLQLMEQAGALQRSLDEYLFPVGPEENRDAEDISEPPVSSSALSAETFRNAAFWRDLARFCQSLEINDPEWFHLLEQLEVRAEEISAQMNAFEAAFSDRSHEYEQLLIYFVYRYMLKAREDGMLYEKIAFAVLSVCLIRALDVLTWINTETLTLWQQIELCKLYSREIEYDEANVEALSLYFNEGYGVS